MIGANHLIYRIPASATAPVPGRVINIGNVTSGLLPAYEKPSPMAGNNRIAYSLQSRTGGYDIWTVTVPGNYNPATDVLMATQIASKGPIAPDTTIGFYENWDWSPYPSKVVLSAGGAVNTIPSTGLRLTTIVSARGVGYNVWLRRN